MRDLPHWKILLVVCDLHECVQDCFSSGTLLEDCRIPSRRVKTQKEISLDFAVLCCL